MKKSDIEKLLSDSDTPINDVRKYLVRCYNEHTSNQLNSDNLLLEDKLSIQSWILKDTSFNSFSTKIKQTLVKSIFVNEDEKLSYIQQVQINCPVCGNNDLRLFPIRISPRSHQNITPALKDFYHKEVQRYPFVNGESDIYNADGLCVQLIFVLRESREKDLDNMAKLILDSLKGHVYADDKAIHHLQLFKFKAKQSEEHIRVGIKTSNLNNHKNVLFKHINSSWYGLHRISFP